MIRAQERTRRIRPRILCVDDEAAVLEGLGAMLRREYEVVTANSGAEGLVALKEKGPFTVVLSDLRMPEMNGAQFLAQAQRIAPHTIRILLTGQSDLDGAIQAVNEGYVFRFLTKPCGPSVLRRALEESVEHARALTADRDLIAMKLEAMADSLLEAERLATVGTLAGAVAHELNNVTAVFINAMHFVQESAKQGQPPDPADLRALERVGNHLQVHAQNLSRLGAPLNDNAGATNFGHVVNEALTMLRAAGMLRRADVTVEVADAEMWVTLGPTRIEQVLVNLVKNAIDAVAERDGSRPVKVSARHTETHAELVVEDAGTGIPQEMIEKIFEPYVTTKPRGKGTGLGLFVVRQILDSVKGTLSIESEVGQGTKMTVRLPLVAPPTRPAQKAS